MRDSNVNVSVNVTDNSTSSGSGGAAPMGAGKKLVLAGAAAVLGVSAATGLTVVTAAEVVGGTGVGGAAVVVAGRSVVKRRTAAVELDSVSHPQLAAAPQRSAVSAAVVPAGRSTGGMPNALAGLVPDGAQVVRHAHVVDTVDPDGRTYRTTITREPLA